MPSPNSAIRWTTLEPGIEHVVFDVPNKSANVFTRELLAELSTALDAWEAAPPAIGLVITSAKPGIYIAGADLVAISRTLDWNQQQIMTFCREGQSIFERLARLPCATVAAIHGVCVGGGLEFALACDVLIATDDRRTLLGLPEVTLGLIPGWAGTVRTPRRIGLAAAIDLVVSGRLVSATQAKDLGLIDATTTPEHLLSRAVEQLRSLQAAQKYVGHRAALRRAKPVSADEVRQLDESFSAAIERRELHPHAPRVALHHMLDSHGDDFSVACEKEAVAMSRVYGSESNAGLLNAFFLNERAKKLGKFDVPAASPIRHVGIAGVGVMGRDIAQACADRLSLTLFDADPDRSRAVAALCNDRPGRTPQVQIAASMGEWNACDLVMESIIENIDAKTQLLTEIEAHVSPATILASNTSVIRIGELATKLRRPQQFCGVHFCFPAQVRRLVEVVRGPETTDQTLAAVCECVRSIGKVPLPVTDSPGFVINRLLCPLFNETGHLLTEGCSAEQIETAMRDFGFAFGPLEFMDSIGLDTIHAAGSYLIPRLATPVEPSLLLHAMNKVGWKGRKAGRGFYDYPMPDGPPQQNRELAALIQQYSQSASPPRSPDEIVRRLLVVMLNQAADLLAEKVVAEADEVDLALILGGGFPPHHGGLIFWARRQGIEGLATAMTQWSSEPKGARRYRKSQHWQRL